MKIGLTYTGSEKKHNNYMKWLKSYSQEIEVVKLCVEDNNLNEVNNCDGLLLSGGVDIHPQNYKNKNLSYRNKPAGFKEARDEFEISIFKLSQQNKTPLLAVCRGMQLVNVVLGGNLKQDLGTNLNKIHWRIDATDATETDKAHGVNVLPETILSDIIKSSRGVANSAHHQAVNRIGKGLHINCKSDDGVIEGLEWKDKKDKSFLLCIQWHPERMFEFHLEDSGLSKGIRDKFLEEINKSKDNQS